MSSRWGAFYRGRMGASYQAYARRRYAPFLAIVQDCVRSGDRVVEGGCGLGTITLQLQAARRRACFGAFDLDPVMCGLAQHQLRRVPVWRGDLCAPVADGADVVHGHGVLEHLDDEAIRRAIAAHRTSGAHHAVHYVPSEQYVTPSFGDERLMSAADWCRIAAPTEIVPFNDGFDLALLWRF